MNDEIIDLRSDTVTVPSKEMMEAMLNAKIGDDVLGDASSVQDLEKYAANMFGKEAAIFCPSGTMTNQIAIKVHTQPGDEVICDKLSHIYNYEGGGIAFNSACSVRLLHGERGLFTSKDIAENINPADVHYAKSSLVVIENTCNKGGGSVYTIDEIEKISALCKEKNLALHLDGARLFNAIVAANYSEKQMGNAVDSISICLSKGLGCPVGSLLIGNKAFIEKAKRIRKVLGGGMRQSGYLAAAGLYSLQHNIPKLVNDHKKAKLLAETLQSLSWVSKVHPTETNIVIFECDKKYDSAKVLAYLNDNGIRCMAMSTQLIRFVTHLNVSFSAIDKVIEKLKMIRF
jgi:threonine aldolase